MSVTIRPKPAYHSIYFGTPICVALSMKSKSRTRFNAAITTTKALKAIPIAPLPKIENVCTPNRLRMNVPRYRSAMAPVAAITPMRNFCVTEMIREAYSTRRTKSVPKVRLTAWIATPGAEALNMAEIPPSTRPSSKAYAGAVNGDHSFLKMVTSAMISPPIAPTISSGNAACGPSVTNRSQVHAAVATVQISRMPVLFTVPCRVMASPAATWPWKALALSAGFEVLSQFGMVKLLSGGPWVARPPVDKTVDTDKATQILAGGSRNFIFWLECPMEGCAIQASFEIRKRQIARQNCCRDLMKLRIVHKSVFAVPVLSVLVVLVLAALVRGGFFDLTELQGYDLLVYVGGAAPANEKIVIVDFDNASVEAIGKYPIPRKTLARVLGRIAEGQPAVIGLDKLLSDTSDKKSDVALALELAEARIVVLPEVFATDQMPADQPASFFRRDDRPMGFVNLIEDADGFIRRMFVFIKTPSVSGLSFPVEIASQFLGQPLTRAEAGVYRLGDLTIHLDGTGRETALLGAWNRQPAKSVVSAARLLSNDFDASVFRGKIVLVGESSTAGKDLYATPVFRFRRPDPGRVQLSGVEIHAVALNSILSGRIIRVMGATAQWSLSFLFIVLASGLVILLWQKFGIPATLLVFGGVFLTADLLFSRANLWMQFVSIEAGVALALTAGLGYRFWREGVLKS